MSDPVVAHALANRDTILARLAEFIAHPSVGADPACAEGMDGARRFLEARLAGTGFTGIDRLAADAVLSADGARWRPDLTTINTGNRGNGGFEITVRTAAKDLHSGHYGGVVPNALHVLARLIASLRDAEGRIVGPGFADGVAEPTAEERAAIAAIPFDEARAKFTMRLVPGQEPGHVRDAVLDHLWAQLPPGASLTVSEDRGWAGTYCVPDDHPLLTAAEDALKETTGDRPIRVRIGATLPLTGIAHRTLGFDTVMFSFSAADEDYHAPNEFLRLSAIDEGLAAWVHLIRRVGTQSPADYAPYRP